MVGPPGRDGVVKGGNNHGKPDKTSVVCYNCQKTGHYKSECPDVKVKLGRMKSPGPEGMEGITKAEVNGQECPMVIDTGATMTAVTGRFIAPSQYTGGQVNVILEDGPSTMLKEAMVKVLLADGKTKPLRVIVLQDNALEGLLGKDHPKTRSLLKSDQPQTVNSVPVQARAITRAQHRAQIKERSEDREADARDSAQSKSSSIEGTPISTQVVTSQADDVIVGTSPNTSPQSGEGEVIDRCSSEEEVQDKIGMRDEVEKEENVVEEEKDLAGMVEADCLTEVSEKSIMICDQPLTTGWRRPQHLLNYNRRMIVWLS